MGNRFSRIINSFTAFVYIFTLLSPTIALASLTQTETLNEDSRGFSSHAPDQQGAQYDLQVSPAFGAESLYLSLNGQRDLISPFRLGTHPTYTEVFLEDGGSLGFSGIIPGVGDFLCQWDGNFSFSNVHEQIDRSTPPTLLSFSSEEQRVSREEAEDLLEESSVNTYHIEPEMNYLCLPTLMDNLSESWDNIAFHMGGAFGPVLDHLGLLSKEAWTFQDLIECATTSLHFLQSNTMTRSYDDYLDNKRLIETHLKEDDFKYFKVHPFFWNMDNSAQEEEAEKAWLALAQNMGDSFQKTVLKNSKPYYLSLLPSVLKFLNHSFPPLDKKDLSSSVPQPAPSLSLETFGEVVLANVFLNTLTLHATDVVFTGGSTITQAVLQQVNTTGVTSFGRIEEGSTLRVQHLDATNSADPFLVLGALEGSDHSTFTFNTLFNSGTIASSEALLTVKNGSNTGLLELAAVSVRQGGTFENLHEATLTDLQGQGQFTNRGLLTALEDISIRRFMNSTSEHLLQRAEVRAEHVNVSGHNLLFVNDEESVFEGDTILFQGGGITSPEAVVNKGSFRVRTLLGLKKRQFINEDDLEASAISLEDALLRNTKYQRIFGVTALDLAGDSSVENAGTFETAGSISQDLFLLLGTQEHGHWIHEGDVELEESSILTGTVTLKNGTFHHDGLKKVINKGTLKLTSFFQETKELSLLNEGQLTFSGDALPGQNKIFIINKKTLILKDLGKTSTPSVFLINFDRAHIEASNPAPFSLVNETTGFVTFDPGTHHFSSFVNKGDAVFGLGDWTFGYPQTERVLCLSSIEAPSFFRSDFAKVPLHSLSPFSFDTPVVFQGDVTFQAPFPLGSLEIPGDLTLPLLKNGLSHGSNSLKDLKDVICHGTTHLVFQRDFLPTTDVVLNGLNRLHIHAPGRIHIQRLLQANALILEGKSFTLGLGNNRFGKVYATGGDLSILVQNALLAKHGHLFSQGDMTLTSRSGSITLGGLISKETQNITTHNSEVGEWFCHPYTTYEPNDSWISSQGNLSLFSPLTITHNTLMWVNGSLYVGSSKNGSRQEGRVFQNIAGHIIVLGNCTLHVANIQNKRTEMTTVTFPRCRTYYQITQQQETSRAAQFHVQGSLQTNAPTFYNQASLVHVAGHFTGNALALYRRIQTSGQGAGWHNITNSLRKKATHHKKSSANGNKSVEALIEPHIQGTFSVGGNFIPPTVEHFENSGLIEARLAEIRTEGDYITSTLGRRQSELRIVPLDQLMAQNGLFGLSQNTTGPVISENIPRQTSGSRVLSQRSQGPRLIIPSRERLESSEGFSAFGFSDLPRELFSPMALNYVFLTGVLPHLPRSYQHLPLNDLLDLLQNNALEYVTHLGVETQSFLLLPGTEKDKNDKQSLLLTNPNHFINAPRVNKPMMVHVEGEYHGIPTLVPWVALPEKTIETGVQRTEKHLKIQTGRNLHSQGSRFESLEDRVDLVADGTIICETFVEEKIHRASKNTTVTTRTNLPTVIKAPEGIKTVSQGPQAHRATILESEGEVLIQGHTVDLLSAQDSVTTETYTKKRGLFSKKEFTETTVQTTHVPTIIKGKKVVVKSTEHLTTEAPHIYAQNGIDFISQKGRIILNAAHENFYHSVKKIDNDWSWNKCEISGESSTTYVEGIYDPGEGEFNFTTPEGITFSHRETSELDGALGIYLKSRPDVIWKALQDEHEEWDECYESLGGPAAAVIAIAVTCLTAGAAGPLMASLATSLQMGATATATLTASFTAGVCSLASQSAVSLISNKGDLGSVIKEISSSQALRSLATSVVTAGVIAGSIEAFDIQTASSVDKANAGLKAGEKAFEHTIGDRIQEALVRTSSETVVNTTLGEMKFDEALIGALRSGVANVAGGVLANKLGIEYKAEGSQIDYVTHKLLHGIIGAGMGALSDGEALAGAIGGVVGEIVGEAYAESNPEAFNPNHQDFDSSLRRDALFKGEALAQISAALAASVLGQDPHVAAHTAQNAVNENSFVLPILEAAGASALICEGYDALKLATDSAIAWWNNDSEALSYYDQQAYDMLLGQGIGLATMGMGYGLGKAARYTTPYARALWNTYLADMPFVQGAAHNISSITQSARSTWQSAWPGYNQTPYLLTSDKVIPNGYHIKNFGEAPYISRNPGRAFDLDQLTLQNGQVKLFDIQKPTSKVHGCSNSYVGETHVYVIRDELGHVYKVGESMQGYTNFGLSKRAELQAKELRIQLGRDFETEVLHRFPTKKLAKERETRTIKVLRKRDGKTAVPGNKTNH